MGRKGKAMKNVTYSSLAAYDHIKAHITGECHRKILAVMLDELIYTRKQIARMLSMETSSIAGRVNELFISYHKFMLVHARTSNARLMHFKRMSSRIKNRSQSRVATMEKRRGL